LIQIRVKKIQNKQVVLTDEMEDLVGNQLKVLTALA
jgi:hypothetical protein